MLIFPNYIIKDILKLIILNNVNELSNEINFNLDFNNNNNNKIISNKNNNINKNIEEIINYFLVSKQWNSTISQIINNLNFINYEILKYFINYNFINNTINYNINNNNKNSKNSNNFVNNNFLIKLNENDLNKIKELNYITAYENNCNLSIVQIEPTENLKYDYSKKETQQNNKSEEREKENTICFKLNRIDINQESFYHLNYSEIFQNKVDTNSILEELDSKLSTLNFNNKSISKKGNVKNKNNKSKILKFQIVNNK
ncbi:hypothetical protein DICPUDRAFT_77074 [Dictyostelium purpureum]|uniref:Uncharacterized protein n=1 Tax=Dictyostelium purpureum TaxID=5786 RepID=F0ZFI6_DICPU|nr:uncharacterized protein DICPUDRAFT_77074 [Dictyostelium purpureum]EGC37287.1 hypothetical protein DICPUDRAFT_77074 [Dictyostelium purpureum]|eukprot:XP_003286175.1 hypothetical protein DICPUDRAFT_77074 [Dictyostelium purpureum]